jgi:hypothetical protein
MEKRESVLECLTRVVIVGGGESFVGRALGFVGYSPFFVFFLGLGKVERGFA